MTFTQLSNDNSAPTYMLMPDLSQFSNASIARPSDSAHVDLERRTNPSESVAGRTLLASRSIVYSDRKTFFEIANDYCDVKNPAADRNKGIALFKNLALQGESQASMRLGFIYRQMDGSSNNFINALFWFQHAMKMNPLFERECKEVCLEIYRDIVSKYWQEEGALKYLLYLAKKEIPLAQYLLAFIYDRGEFFDIPPKPKKAMCWYEECAKTIQHVDLYFDLGLRYINGEGISKSVPKAIRCFEQAEILGHEQARIELGLIYFKDKKERFTMALGYLNTELDKNDPRAFFALGEMYLNGLGVEKDSSRALVHYEEAAHRGYAEAQTKLGRLYAGDFGGPQNYPQAAHWFKKAAKEHDCLALYKMGIFYYNGRGVRESPAKAFEYLYRLSTHLTDEFKKDYPKMMAHFEYVLGLMYFEGKGTNQNENEGINWLKKAISHGQRQAKDYLKEHKLLL